MQQYLHLLVVDRRQRTALIQTVDRRWLLPVVACPERARAPLVAARWLSDRHISGVVAGQWCGRIAANGRSIDWLMAVAAAAPLRSPPFGCAVIDGLEAARAVLDYQAWGVQHVAALGGLGVGGPFGSFDWIDDARSWIESTGLTGVSSPTCFRASAYDVVLGVRSGPAVVYFKGAAPDRASDLHAMAAAAEALPESFPRTFALEERGDSTRWLLEGCAGVSLARAREHDVVVRVAHDIGRLQQMVALESRQSTLDLAGILENADRLLESAGLPSMSGTTRRAFDAVTLLRAGWTPLDLDPSNVFVDGCRIRYIDLEPRLTAMPIALSVLARRVAGTGDLLAAMREAYESTAAERVPWPCVDLVSELTEIVTGWHRVLRNVERGEVSGPLDSVERAAARRVASAKPLV